MHHKKKQSFQKSESCFISATQDDPRTGISLNQLLGFEAAVTFRPPTRTHLEKSRKLGIVVVWTFASATFWFFLHCCCGSLNVCVWHIFFLFALLLFLWTFAFATYLHFSSKLAYQANGEDDCTCDHRRFFLVHG